MLVTLGQVITTYLVKREPTRDCTWIYYTKNLSNVFETGWSTSGHSYIHIGPYSATQHIQISIIPPRQFINLCYHFIKNEYFLFGMLAGELYPLVSKKMVKRHEPRLIWGKPGKKLNNGKPHLKHHNTYKTSVMQTTRNPQLGTRATPLKVHTKSCLIDLTIMSIFAILDGAREECHARKRTNVPLWACEESPKGSSDTPSMWRVLV
jgi:hypothetical protein